MPFGYKANLWKIDEPLHHKAWMSTPYKIGTNPVEVMGTRNDYTGKRFLEFSKKMVSAGATILGGCCETKPFHINEIAKLKN